MMQIFIPFSDNVEPKNVVPMDFLGYDIDSSIYGGIPVIVKAPFYVKTTR